MALHVAAVKPTTLKSSLSASAGSVVLASLEDRHGNSVSMSTFGEWGTIVVKSGDQWECIKFDGLANNADGSVTLTVASNGRKILPVSPFTGGSTGFDFIAGSDVIVTNDGLIMNSFGNTENAQTWNEIQTFVQPPVLPAPVANTDGANKQYVDGVAVAGAPNAGTVTKGIVEEATQAEVDAKTQAGGTGAELFVNPANLRATKYADPAASTGSANAYVLAPSPAFTAYAVGQQFSFIANFANTGPATLNVNGLGAKTIKKNGSIDLVSGDIASGQAVTVIYDGTNMQMVSEVAPVKVSQSGAEIYAADGGATDSYAITLTPAPTAYVTGMVIRFKANTANTGPATLNVNSLGAKTIKRKGNVDLNDNDIVANQIVEVVYDGTNFQLQSAPNLPNGYELVTNTGSGPAGASNASVTVTCSAGKKVVGGGGSISGGTTTAYLIASYPSANNQWTVTFAGASAGSAGTITAYAVAIDA